MQTVWVTTAEVRVEPGDMPSDQVLGFMKITMWASSETEFIERLRTYLARYKWELISAENTAQVDPNHDYGDELNQMIDETLANDNFIRLGTFYSYKPE
jgi:hypothetical protein